MSSGAGREGRAAPRVINPLWIISLFVGLSETTVGVAATQAVGWVQGLLAVTATVFPVLVSGAFFATIWLRPEVLYAPGDFPEHVPVPDFVHGLHRSGAASVDLVGSLLRETLESVLPAVLAPQIPGGEVDQVVGAVLAGAQNDLEARILRVDLNLVSAELGVLEVVVDNRLTADGLLDMIWAAMREKVYIRAYTYGTDWVLIERSSLKAFDHMGSSWAEAQGLDDDERQLEQVGIVPGTELAVVRVADRRLPSGQARSASAAPRSVRVDVPKAR